jgi:hypothetical protein
MALVRVEALQYHTYDGQTYHAGDVYDADPQYLDTLEALQFARPVPPKDRGKTKPGAVEPLGVSPRSQPSAASKPTKD